MEKLKSLFRKKSTETWVFVECLGDTYNGFFRVQKEKFVAREKW